ncbi:hypothetical protein [Neisseria sicca]|uniref:hypothetical protein n=1 Tax=Neisseria sicca TaxID=490 RepID=UPI000D2FDA68|nr:hypothetical protein [Neisseria sicca]MBF1285222.1 hypothetical protein [Neisseria sp.]
MKNNRLMLLFVLFLSACHSGKNQFTNWSQHEEEGPTDKHAHIVIENKQSNSYIEMLRTENGLSAIGIDNGTPNPQTRIGIQFNKEDNSVRYIRINENTELNGEYHKREFLIKKINEKWSLEEVTD